MSGYVPELILSQTGIWKQGPSPATAGECNAVTMTESSGSVNRKINSCCRKEVYVFIFRKRPGGVKL